MSIEPSSAASADGHARPARPRRRPAPDIRALGDLLGETLVRQEGPELLDLVEQVRTPHARRPRRRGRRARAARHGRPRRGSSARSRPTSTSPTSPSRSTAAASCAAAAPSSDGTWLAAGDRPDPGRRRTPPARSPPTCATLNLRPVFTAHPTEAARRSVLTKLRRIAALLDDERARARRPGGRPDAERRVRRRLAELVDLLWQTDELRVVRPEPIDEARNAVYYLDELHADAVPRRARGRSRRARAHRRRAARSTRRPLTFGTWIGGDRDGNPNVTPAVDARRPRPAARARHPRRARRRRRAARASCPSSVRITGVTAELEASLARRPRAPPRARPALPAASTPRSPTGSSSPASA